MKRVATDRFGGRETDEVPVDLPTRGWTGHVRGSRLNSERAGSIRGDYRGLDSPGKREKISSLGVDDERLGLHSSNRFDVEGFADKNKELSLDMKPYFLYFQALFLLISMMIGFFSLVYLLSL